MGMPRRITACLALSADGFIARRDGSVDWLNRPEPKGGYGLAAFAASIDTILWGHTTFRHGLQLGELSAFGPVQHYVFSRSPQSDRFPNVKFIRSPIPRFARELRRRPGKDIWLMGGAALFGAFLDAGQIDHLLIHLIPTVIGEGIPLFAPARRDVPLRLLSSRRYSDGVVRLHYAVLNAPAGKSD